MQDSIARRQQRTDDLVFRLAQAQSRVLKTYSRRLDIVESSLRRHDLRVRTGEMRRQLDGRTTQLNTAMNQWLANQRNAVNALTASLSSAAPNIVLRRRGRWERVHSSLEALSPKAILARGYALVFDEKGQLVKRASQVKSGAHVRTQLGRGEFTSKVERVEEPDES
jgi:exodeoxyribonuclease VII large subunit